MQSASTAPFLCVVIYDYNKYMETPNIEPPYQGMLEQRNDIAERKVREIAMDLSGDDFANALFPGTAADPLNRMRQIQDAIKQIEVYFPGPRIAELSGDINALYAELGAD
jgi:hypothetical protein